MNRKAEQLNRRAGFTIIELLTVMSIIIILISILVPSLNRVKRYALYVKQKKTFNSIDTGLTMYNAEFDGYPESSQFDPSLTIPYCGAMRLAEAMVGQDVLGFHPQSHFYQKGTTDGAAPGSPTSAVPPGNDLYPARRGALVTIPPTLPTPPTAAERAVIEASERERKELYLTRENANIFVMGELFDNTQISAIFGADAYSLPVLCDAYSNIPNRRTGKNVGTPILYYKASARNQSFDMAPASQAVAAKNIYNHLDNSDLLRLEVPWMPGTYHPMGVPAGSPTPLGTTVTANPFIFYDAIRNEKITMPMPFNSDSYILISAGFDGLYGTKDDVFNFEK
jgi:type II secretory pathway pseudopilin PulG